MVRSVAFYTFAAICTNLLLDSSLKVHGLENPFDDLEAEAEKLLKDIAINIEFLQTENEEIITIRADSVPKVIDESKDSLKKKLEKWRSEGKDVSQCQKVAEAETADFAKMAKAELNACVSPDLNKPEIVFNIIAAHKTPAQNIAVKIKATAEKCSAKTLTPEESNKCSEINVARLKAVLDNVKSKAMETVEDGYVEIFKIFRRSVECIRTTSGTLKDILNAIEIDVDNCVAAAQ